MPRIFPSGRFTGDHFRKGGINVKITPTGKRKLTYQGRQMTVSEEFYQSRLEIADAYRNTEDYFNSFYWGTQRGIRQKDANYKENFDTAIRSKFEDANTPDLQYAIDIWKNMSFEERDKFTNDNPEWVTQTFKYEDKRAKSLGVYPEEDEEISDIDYDSIYEFIKILEQYISPSKLERIQRKNRRL